MFYQLFLAGVPVLWGFVKVLVGTQQLGIQVISIFSCHIQVFVQLFHALLDCSLGNLILSFCLTSCQLEFHLSHYNQP